MTAPEHTPAAARSVGDAGEALLPCPFCGGEAKRITLTEADGDDEGGDVIYCTGVCGASSHVEFGFKENLVSLWNTRLAHPQSGDVGALREALQQIVDNDDAEASTADLMQQDRNAGYLAGARDAANIARAGLDSAPTTDAARHVAFEEADMQAYRLDAIRNDGGTLTLADKANLRIAADMLRANKCKFSSATVEQSPCPMCGLSPVGNTCSLDDDEVA